jgi:hypothetical protein
LEAYYKHYDFTLWSTEQEKDFDEPISMKLIRSMRHLTLEQMDLDKLGEYSTYEFTQYNSSSSANYWLGSQKIIRYDGDDLSDSDTTVRVGPRAPRRYFRDFIRHEWHNPSLAKIRQAMNLRKLVASIMMRGPTTAPSSDVLEFVDLMHLFFPLLEDVKVQVLNTESWPRKSLSLAKHEKEFETKKKVVYLNVYMEEKEKKNVGVGFECCWLAKDGKKKYFVMEESWSGDWIPVHLRARDSSFLAKVE